MGGATQVPGERDGEGEEEQEAGLRPGDLEDDVLGRRPPAASACSSRPLVVAPPPDPRPFPPPAPWPSRPSEFSSISWMRGGMEPGISIFSVITRSAPGGAERKREGERNKERVIQIRLLVY